MQFVGVHLIASTMSALPPISTTTTTRSSSVSLAERLRRKNHRIRTLNNDRQAQQHHLLRMVLIAVAKTYSNPTTLMAVHRAFDTGNLLQQRKEETKAIHRFLFVHECAFRYGIGQIQRARKSFSVLGAGVLTPQHRQHFDRTGWLVLDQYLPGKAVRGVRDSIERDTRSLVWRSPLNSKSTRDDQIAWLSPSSHDNNEGTKEGTKKETENAAQEAPQEGTQDVQETLIGLFQPLLKEIAGWVPGSSVEGTPLAVEYQLANYGQSAAGYSRHLDYTLHVRQGGGGGAAAGGADDDGGGKSGGSATTAAVTGRYLSAVLYLNDQWSDTQGGDLRVWPPRSCSFSSASSAAAVGVLATTTSYVDISPRGGRLVVFLSSSIPHQVRRIKSTQNRIALTAWVHGQYY